MANPAAAASSKTYRKGVNMLSRALHRVPRHTAKPSKDYRRLVADVDQLLRENALEWYERGLRRGYAMATDHVVEGKLPFDGETLTCSRDIVLKLKVRFKGGKWQPVSYTFSPEEVGFE